MTATVIEPEPEHMTRDELVAELLRLRQLTKLTRENTSASASSSTGTTAVGGVSL